MLRYNDYGDKKWCQSNNPDNIEYLEFLDFLMKNFDTIKKCTHVDFPVMKKYKMLRKIADKCDMHLQSPCYTEDDRVSSTCLYETSMLPRLKSYYELDSNHDFFKEVVNEIEENLKLADSLLSNETTLNYNLKSTELTNRVIPNPNCHAHSFRIINNFKDINFEQISKMMYYLQINIDMYVEKVLIFSRKHCTYNDFIKDDIVKSTLKSLNGFMCEMEFLKSRCFDIKVSEK
jgi:hypothetical protein